MAKNILPTNFQDDIISDSMNGKRKYRMIQNTDGTVSFEDVTTYDKVGSNFGQAQINATNEAVNESADKNKILDSIDEIAANTQPGYIAGALAVSSLNSNLEIKVSCSKSQKIKIWIDDNADKVYFYIMNDDGSIAKIISK